MFGDQKDTQQNLKDSSQDLGLSLKDAFNPISYTKTNKLVTALYMVTDIIDKDEPLRNKLRTLGIEIISHTYTDPAEAGKKIYEIVSFLDVASAISLISEMNRNILKKEFLELHRSITEYTQAKQLPMSLEDFLINPEDNVPDTSLNAGAHFGNNGHQLNSNNSFRNKETRTRIGVQKGSTLMKALSDRTNVMANKNSDDSRQNFDVLKNSRRFDIVNIIRDKKNDKEGGITIKDIKTDIKDKNLESLASTSEKTLQRELMSMVKDGVLNKTGEKRWSKYFLPNN